MNIGGKFHPGNKVIWPFQDKPLWKGERGKRVALWKEQGIGDDIIFLSLVPEVKEMCEHIYQYMWIHVYKPYASVPCRR